MNDIGYELYKAAKRIIEKSDIHDKNSENEEYFQQVREGIKSLDATNRGYAERYQREKDLISSFTPEQINHICSQIGNWYLMMKPLLEGQHNLGYMKEKLKTMICGE